jgi:hypothetical protein
VYIPSKPPKYIYIIQKKSHLSKENILTYIFIMLYILFTTYSPHTYIPSQPIYSIGANGILFFPNMSKNIPNNPPKIYVHTSPYILYIYISHIISPTYSPLYASVSPKNSPIRRSPAPIHVGISRSGYGLYLSSISTFHTKNAKGKSIYAKSK